MGGRARPGFGTTCDLVDDDASGEAPEEGCGTGVGASAPSKWDRRTGGSESLDPGAVGGLGWVDTRRTFRMAPKRTIP